MSAVPADADTLRPAFRALLARDDLAQVLGALNRDGEEARLVGGAVRDVAMGRAAGDFDIATTARPEAVVARMQAAGLRTVPTGIDHGTVTVIAQGRPFEVTTLREDVETDGRHAVVRFGRDWRADALRRDFTLNAMSVSADGALHDYAGGLADAAARRVRFIGDADRRIAEDHLRILRFFRFHALCAEGAPDEAALAACIRGRAGLEALSRERLRAELLKLLVAPGAVAALVAMNDAGLLTRVLGGVAYVVPLARLVALEAALAMPADAIRRLAVLSARVNDDAERVGERLRLSRAESAQLTRLAEGWRRLYAGMDARASRKAFAGLSGPLLELVAVAMAQRSADAGDDAWRATLEVARHWSAPEFPLRAADFIARGLKEGPALGVALARARASWIEADFPADASALAAIADAAIRER